MVKGVRSILLILMLFRASSCADDSCGAIASLTDAQTWSYFTFSQFEGYFVYVVGSVCLAVLVLALLTYLINPSLAVPADIVFIIIVAQLVDIITILTQVIYHNNNKGDSPPASFNNFCRGIGFINMISNVVVNCYSAFFCAVLAYSIHDTLRTPTFTQLKAHLLFLALCSCTCLILLLSHDPQDATKGMCVYRLASTSSLSQCLLSVVLAIVGIFSMRQFRSKVPSNSYFESKAHFRYFFTYMLIFAIVQIIFAGLYLIGYAGCKGQANNYSALLNWVYTVSNIVLIGQAFATALLRLIHPLFLSRIQAACGQAHHKQRAEELTWLNSLIQSIKGSQLLSYIEAITINVIEHSHKIPKFLTPYHFSKEYSFQLNQKIAEEYIRRRITDRESHFVREHTAGLKTLAYDVTIYTPDYYSWLVGRQSVNLFASLDTRKNLERVKTESYTNGGKSGQFFFATHDHCMIFKTIQLEQAKPYIQKTQAFHKYFQNNEDSLIVKILGLYRFTRTDVEGQSVFLMLMRNLTASPKQHSFRVFDIKGSQYNRSTLREQNIDASDQTQLRKHTLKDLDFLEVEGKITIQAQQAMNIKRILSRDIQFLGDLGLMDYSVLIIKRSGQARKEPGQYASVAQQGVFYHIGVIDYLREWSIKSQAERIFKTMITREEITAESPDIYAKRLVNFIGQIL